MLPSPAATRWRQLARRYWMHEEPSTGWFDLVVQQLFVEARPAADSATARAWALESLADEGLDVHTTRVGIGTMPWTEIPAGEAASVPTAPNAVAERDPVQILLDDCSEEQVESIRVDVRKVTKALAAWRAARAQENRPTAANTPFQRAFLHDLAVRYGIADSTATSMVHVAERLGTRMPASWSLFLGCRVPWRAMQAVHAELDGLDPELFPVFDAAVAKKLLDTAPSRLRDAVRRERERIQARTADDRYEKAFRERTVRTDLAADGMAYTTIYWAAATALAFQHQLTKAAIAAHGEQDETRGIAQLKADIVDDFAHDFLRRHASRKDVGVPIRRGVAPRISILIPAMTALGHSDAPAILQGYGPIGIRTAMRLAGEATSWVRVLTDPFTGAILNLGRRKYRPTKDMRTLLRLLDGGNRGPGTDRPPEDNDIDHLESYHLGEEQGLTTIENLMLLSRADHITKTAGEQRPRLLPDRTVVWTIRRRSDSS